MQSKKKLKKDEIDAGCKISTFTLSTILKNENGNKLQKKSKSAELSDMVECLFSKFKQCRDKNIPLHRPLMKGKADFFAKN